MKKMVNRRAGKTHNERKRGNEENGNVKEELGIKNRNKQKATRDDKLRKKTEKGRTRKRCTHMTLVNLNNQT